MMLVVRGKVLGPHGCLLRDHSCTVGLSFFWTKA